MNTLWAKIGWVSIFLKNRLQIDANDLNLWVAKCIFSKSTPQQQYTRPQPSTSSAYLPTPMHTLWAKIGCVSIFFKNRFQIDANDLNLRVAKSIFSQSTPHQHYTRQPPSSPNTYFSTPMHTLWAKIGWVGMFLKNRFQIDANYLNLRVAKCIFSKSTPLQQYTRQPPSTSNTYLSTPTHPLIKNWLSQHIFKKQIPNWRKLPQFESCQLYIFKIYSSPTIHQTITFNLNCIFIHSHEHPLSKNWLSQHIFEDFENIHLATLKLRSFASIWNLFFKNMLTQPIFAQRMCGSGQIYIWGWRLLSGVLLMRSRFWKYTFGNSQIEVICVNLESVF